MKQFKIISLHDTDKQDYYMDIDGNAYSTKRNSIYKLKKYDNGHGYEFIRVCENGKPKNMRVGRLMGNAFLGLKLDSKLQVNHINKVRNDDRLSNLEIVTAKQNMRHAHGHKDYKEVE